MYLSRVRLKCFHTAVRQHCQMSALHIYTSKLTNENNTIKRMQYALL